MLPEPKRAYFGPSRKSLAQPCNFWFRSATNTSVSFQPNVRSRHLTDLRAHLRHGFLGGLAPEERRPGFGPVTAAQRVAQEIKGFLRDPTHPGFLRVDRQLVSFLTGVTH